MWMFLSGFFFFFKLLLKSNLLPLWKPLQSKFTCLGFVGITLGLAEAERSISGRVKVDEVSGKLLVFGKLILDFSFRWCGLKDGFCRCWTETFKKKTRTREN